MQNNNFVTSMKNFKNMLPIEDHVISDELIQKVEQLMFEPSQGVEVDYDFYPIGGFGNIEFQRHRFSGYKYSFGSSGYIKTSEKKNGGEVLKKRTLRSYQNNFGDHPFSDAINSFTDYVIKREAISRDKQTDVFDSQIKERLPVLYNYHPAIHTRHFCFSSDKKKVLMILVNKTGNDYTIWDIHDAYVDFPLILIDYARAFVVKSVSKSEFFNCCLRLAHSINCMSMRAGHCDSEISRAMYHTILDLMFMPHYHESKREYFSNRLYNHLKNIDNDFRVELFLRGDADV